MALDQDASGLVLEIYYMPLLEKIIMLLEGHSKGEREPGVSGRHISTPAKNYFLITIAKRN
jgi:hypothetical protein